MIEICFSLNRSVCYSPTCPGSGCSIGRNSRPCKDHPRWGEGRCLPGWSTPADRCGGAEKQGTHLSQVWRRVGKEMKSKEEENEDEETNRASNSGHVSVHWSSIKFESVAVTGKPGTGMNLRYGMKILQTMANDRWWILCLIVCTGVFLHS